MNKITNTTQIVEFIQQIPTLQNQLNNINEEMNNYLKFMKNNNFEKKENESKEDALRRAESILDRLIEIEERRNELKENSQEASEMIETMKKKIDEIKNECEKDDDTFCDANIETIDEIIEIRRLIMEEKNAPHHEEIQKNKNDFEMNKAEFMKRKEKMEKKKEEIRKRKEEEERIAREERERKEAEERRRLVNEVIDSNEKNQLDQWTNKKCSEVLFDSDKDNWNVNTSVFDSKVMNKSNLAIIVEDTNNNKFGYYFNGTVNKYESYIKAEGSFLFTLKSNGRVNGMYKFEEKDNCCGFYVYGKSSEYLWCVGFGIIFMKENKKSTSGVCNDSNYFDFHGLSNVFLSNSSSDWVEFTPKRLTVIEMK